MIFPWIKGWQSYVKAPVTWMLIFLNIFLFVITHQASSPKESLLERKMFSESSVKVQAALYEQYLLKNANSPQYQEILSLLAAAETIEQKRHLLLMASFKNMNFLNQAPELEPYGDAVLYAEWKTSYLQFMDAKFLKNINIYGITSQGRSWSHYLLYQFMHAGLIHLLSNLFALFVFGAALELGFGAIWLLLVYITGGVAGALAFDIFSGFSFSPLVGASGAVSALVGFYLIVEFRRNIRFFYFISPFEGYHGEIYLNRWWILVVIFLTDVAALIAEPSWLMMGVAYTTHLGAGVFGVLLGLAYKAYRYLTNSSVNVAISK